MTNSDTVVIERMIPAPPQKVFEAWLDPEALQQFMLGSPGVRVSRVECDPRKGGQFVIVMNVGDREIPHTGEYLEVDRYTRLVFTWLSPYASDGSRVTLRFADGPDGQTKLTLEHEGLRDAASVRGHHDGWSNILAELSALGSLRVAH